MTEVKEQLVVDIKEDDRPTSVMAFNYTEKFLVDVKQSNLLPDSLEQKVQAMLPELQHSFNTQTIWRTETEIIASVLNDKDFPDKASKYHQAKLEQKVFFEQVLQLSFDYRQLQRDIELKELEIEEKEIEISELKSVINELDPDLTSVDPRKAKIAVKKAENELEKLRIQLEQMVYGIENMRIQGRERVRELEIWSDIKKQLDDGSFDKDDRNTNQLVSFTKSYIKKAYDAVHVGQGTDIASYSNVMAQFKSGIQLCLQKNILLTHIIPGLEFEYVKFVDAYFNLELRDEQAGMMIKDQRFPGDTGKE